MIGRIDMQMIICMSMQYQKTLQDVLDQHRSQLTKGEIVTILAIKVAISAKARFIIDSIRFDLYLNEFEKLDMIVRKSEELERLYYQAEELCQRVANQAPESTLPQ